MPESGPQILVVDDSRLSRAALESVLTADGFPRVISAASAAEAFTVLGLELDPGAAPPLDVDLIILDVVMPDLDGIEACRLIKDSERLKDIPIVMVTVKEDMDSLFEAFKAGATDYIVKPVKEIELLARVNSALALKKERDRRKAREKELLDITGRLASANQELRRRSSLDGLTSVPNRRYFDEAFEAEWRRAQRGDKTLALIMADIDFFKNYNDTYGHLKGDDCLRRVARTMAGNLRRAGDLMARYGGEEFSVLLPDTDLSGATHLAEALRNHVAELALHHAGSEVSDVITISLGVAAMQPGRESRPEDLIALADKALYQAKDAGRNQVAVSEESSD